MEGDATDRLCELVLAGNTRAADDLVGVLVASPNEQRDPILDRLAADRGSQQLACDVLVRAVYEMDFARAEIRTLLFRDDEAEEALQETVLGVVRGLANFRGDALFRTWVRRIAHNQAVNVLRRKEPIVGSAEPAVETPVQSFTSALATSRDVRAAVAALPEEFRQVVELRDLHERSYAAIAEELNLPLNTVRSRLARGRSRVMATMAGGSI